MMRSKTKIFSRKLALLSSVAIGIVTFHHTTNAQTVEPVVETVTGTEEATQNNEIKQTPLEELEAQKIEILIQPNDNHDVEHGVTIPIPAQFENIPRDFGDLADGVTVNGFGRYIDIDEETKIGQFIIQSVQKGDKIEVLNAERFSGQFDMSDPRFDNEETYPVIGYKEELFAALQRLQEEEDDEVEDGEDGQDGKDTQGNTQRDAGRASSNAGANDQAAAYQTPAPLNPVASPEITSREIACDFRIDRAQGKVIPQTKTEILEDGEVVGATECGDTIDRYDIERDYSSCKPETNLETLTATLRFQEYFVGPEFTRKPLSDGCLEDTENVREIIEDFGSCKQVELDFESEKAIPQSKLIFHDFFGTPTEARSCQASIKKAPVDLISTTESCKIRNDFDNNVSYGRHKWTYELDGGVYNATACLDNEIEYPHLKLFKDSNGQNICKPVVNDAQTKVALFYKKFIEVDHVKTAITECLPDPDAELDVESTKDGCQNPAVWDHRLDAGESFDLISFFYEDDGVRVPVETCVPSETRYPHNIREAGYDMHDDGKYYFQKFETYINLDNGETFTVKSASVLDGAAQIPYTYVRQDTVPTGVNTYSGCDAYRETAVSKIWDRPDGTQYNEAVGAGSSLGPVHACGSETITWARTGFDYINHTSSKGQGSYIATNFLTTVSSLRYGTYWSRGANAFGSGYARTGGYAVTKEGVYTGTKSTTREDGQVLSESKSLKVACGYSIEDRNNYAGAKANLDSMPLEHLTACPTTPTNEQANSFNISVGW